MKRILLLCVLLLATTILTACGGVNVTINFDTDGGTEIVSINTDGVSSINIPNNPEKEGFVFDGWYWDEGTFLRPFTANSLLDEPISGDLTVYAKWLPESLLTTSFEVNFDTQGGSAVDKQTVLFRDAITEPDEPTRLGYLFAGWFKDRNYNEEWNFITDKVENNLTLYSKWNVISEDYHIVHFISNFDTEVPSQQVLKGSALSVPNITREGYTLEGWYTSLNNGAILDEKWSFTSNVVNTNFTLYAKWLPNEFTITLELNGGVGETTLTERYTLPIDAPLPEKEGHTFDGWFTDSEITNPYVFTTMPPQNFILYAKWNINAYTITFEANDGSIVDPITQDYATVITEPITPTRIGYTFAGWYSDEELTISYTYTTMPSEDLTLYAKWNTITYNITYELYDGINNVGNPNTYTIETSTITLEEATKEGFTFLGWYDNEEYSGDIITEIIIATMPSTDITIYAKWDTAIPPTEIVIMHGAPYEVDPFHANFTGTEQLAKQQLQREIEERLNVAITYKAYPYNAAWGPSRVTAIINSSIAGDQLADIYWSNSDWIQALAKGDAIVPIDQYLSTTGSHISNSYLEAGTFQGHNYGFENGNLTVDVGLYFNASLVAKLGVDNPTQLYLDGEWTWSRFDTWATQVQTMLSAQAEDMHALGGMLSFYAESMIPLNGGRLINTSTGRVAFAQNPALETYTFLNSLYTKGLFELTPQYDAGSPEWMAGKVAIHPGSLWFVNADNRWGTIAFELGFVPYPRSDSYVGDYASPVSGVEIYHVASGMTQEKEALVFQVWNELQLWKTETQLRDVFELSLLTKFDDEMYVEAYLDIYDKTYLDLCNAIGISPYSENGWRRNVNLAIREGTARTVMDQIKPIYDVALETYLNG